MKIRFSIVDFPDRKKKGWDFCSSLSVKITNSYFEIPFVPQKGWIVDIEPFFENSDSFSNDEKEFLFDDPFYRIDMIYMNPDFLEIGLIYDGVPERV